MSTATPECRHARLHIGADPQHLPGDVERHVSGCAACSRFLAETRALDGRLRGALELPLNQFRAPARPRWMALAASLLLGLLVAGSVWIFQSPPALASEIARHVLHESGSWQLHERLPPAAVESVLNAAGVQFDSSLPVVYASACPFRGGRVPHLVVQTADGPLTVMLLPHEKVAKRAEFAEEGLHGVLLPAGEGSVAVLTRGEGVPEPLARAIVSGTRW